MTADQFHALAVRLAVEAGADPERARERMAQAATVYAADTAGSVAAEVEAYRKACRDEDAALTSIACMPGVPGRVYSYAREKREATAAVLLLTISRGGNLGAGST